MMRERKYLVWRSHFSVKECERPLVLKLGFTVKCSERVVGNRLWNDREGDRLGK